MTPRETSTESDRLTPSTAFLDRTKAEIADNIDATEPVGAPTYADYPNQREVWVSVAQEVDLLRTMLEALALDIHAHPEVAFEERHAASVLADALEAEGLGVERGAHGIDTALRSEFWTADFDPAIHPTVAILSEYDALPGIGHACGHNLIATAGLGGFLSAVRTLRKSGGSQADAEVQGRLVFLGTPAEEGHSGKEYLIRAGAFEGIDASIMMHPFSMDIGSHAWVGRRSVRVTFHGVAAHASSQPFMGRNALDAAVLVYQAMGLLRQQMPPSDRLHSVIVDGGKRPSIIPQTATLDVYLRSLHVDTLADLSQRVEDIFDGAALMTGCRVEKHWDPHPATLPVRNNESLVARWRTAQAGQGRQALPANTVPDSLAASTDFGNVSHLVPGLHPMVKIAEDDVALHTEGMRKAAASSDGLRGMLDAAVGLGQVGLDLLFDARLLESARAEFAAAGGPVRAHELFGETADER